MQIIDPTEHRIISAWHTRDEPEGQPCDGTAPPRAPHQRPIISVAEAEAEIRLRLLSDIVRGA